MRALLYDIHGNLAALDTVLEDARKRGARAFVLGGDYALFGARPEETVARLRELDAVWVRGNGERWTANPTDAPDLTLIQRSITDCRGRLGETLVGELVSLPEQTDVEGTLFCHASPDSDLETFAPQPDERDAGLLETTEQPTIVFGHSHVQFSRRAKGRLLVNPGSVGMPFDGDTRAAYALWAGGDKIELRRVAYDADSYADELHGRLAGELGDAVETLVRRVRQAAFVD
ncbi:hypothetical protein LCGC14_1919010 [marine sediment metagenome]|uniref:Calcineurin-like phosphoesterase domain-containing protein n=1 Tax=marine sediment metagenome TaxID=412755 RepID=A0A0F9I5C2_9ZZZZ